MIKLLEGFKTSLLNDFEEGYRIDRPDRITVLAGADKILTLMRSFVGDSNTPLTFYIAIPSKLEDMVRIRDATDFQLGVIERDSMDVFVAEELSKDDALEILNKFGNIIVNDGLTFFSFVRPDGIRLSKGKYNTVVALNTNEDLSYLAYLAFLLRRNSIPESDELVTIEEAISEKDAVIVMTYENEDGHDVYETVEYLKNIYGIRFVKRGIVS